MADNKPQFAHDGYQLLKKGWSPQSSNAQHPVGSGGKSPPTGGSGVSPSTTRAPPAKKP
ncbi:MAG: hypothetical protein JWQ16_651 [Novosphingobium sp.]|nr:hypothetical protein [Novosphingobium sp.]